MNTNQICTFFEIILFFKKQKANIGMIVRTKQKGDDKMEHPRQLIEEYEINSFTVLVMPITYGSKVFSKIYEFDEECVSPFRPIDIIRESCEFFGSSFEGRKDGTRKLVGFTHKVPIAISPPNNIYFFPTTSPENPRCIWVAHDHVVSYKKGEQNSTIVHFKNNQCMQLPISSSSFQNQVIRTMMLQSKLSQRIEDTKKAVPTKKTKVLESAENPESYSF